MEESVATIGDYRILRTLGSGTTCKVKLAQSIVNGEYYAIKIVKKSQFEEKPNLETKIYREISLMKMADHPHIIKLHDVLESTRHIHIVLEYAPNGELFDYLVKSKCFKEDVAIEFFRQIIYALEYLHQHNICHRDLKPENILLDKHNGIKIADFGFAKWMREGVAITSCGSPHYAAPEVIRGLQYDGCVADIWSAGVILFALLAGYLPFDDHSIHNLLQKVKRGRFVMPSDFPPQMQDLIRRMTTVDVNARIKMEEIKQHPAFLYGLPGAYVLPAPIKLLSIDQPLDVTKIPDRVFATLKRIGISDTEAVESLKSETSNQAKILVDMMMQRSHLEDLPWETATTEIDNRQVSNGIMDGVVNFSSLHQGDQEISVYEVPPSLAMPATWLPSAPQIEFQNIDYFGPSSQSLPFIMCEIQKLLVSSGLIFFHPNDFTLIARYEEDSYVRIEAELSETGILLTVKTNGQIHLLTSLLYSRINEIVAY